MAGERSWTARPWPARIRAGPRTSIGSIVPSTPTPFATCSGSEIDATAMLPPDAQAHGFDTNADALVDGAGAAGSLSDRGGEDRPRGHRRPDAPADVRALHRRQGQLERADVAVADRAAGRRLSARLARRDRGASLLPGRWRIRPQGPAAEDLRRRHPRVERAERDRDSRRWRARRTVHDRRRRVAAADRAARTVRMRRRPPTTR